jgi:hypothetical protein
MVLLSIESNFALATSVLNCSPEFALHLKVNKGIKWALAHFYARKALHPLAPYAAFLIFSTTVSPVFPAKLISASILK